MKFCDNCGTIMRVSMQRYLCPKCGHSDLIEKSKEIEQKIYHDSDPIYVIDNSQIEYSQVNQVCPLCGAQQAFYWQSQVSGEHAGVPQERTIDHYKCTKCLYMWSESH